MNYFIIGQTKTFMKKIVILLPLLLFLNCGPEAKMYLRTYIVENDTQVKIQLNFYRKFDGVLLKEIKLDPNTRYKGEQIEVSQPLTNDPNMLYPSIALSSDSLIIIFNNQKMKTDVVYDIEDGIFYSEPIERNIFRHGSYKNIGGDNFLFSITQQDLENATSCDGDCL